MKDERIFHSWIKDETILHPSMKDVCRRSSSKKGSSDLESGEVVVGAVVVISSEVNSPKLGAFMWMCLSCDRWPFSA
jgi:hypothetical protein